MRNCNYVRAFVYSTWMLGRLRVADQTDRFQALFNVLFLSDAVISGRCICALKRPQKKKQPSLSMQFAVPKEGRPTVSESSPTLRRSELKSLGTLREEDSYLAEQQIPLRPHGTRTIIWYTHGALGHDMVAPVEPSPNIYNTAMWTRILDRTLE